MGRSGQGRYPEGDTPHNAYSRGRPVTDDIGIVGKVLFWYVGPGQTGRLVIVHSDGILRPNDEYLRGMKKAVTDNVVYSRDTAAYWPKHRPPLKKTPSQTECGGVKNSCSYNRKLNVEELVCALLFMPLAQRAGRTHSTAPHFLN